MQPVPIENLLIHADFVRELTRALVADPHECADLEQEAWLQAMRRPPAQSTSLRGWLAALVGSLWRNRARDRQRRRLREFASAPPPDADPVDVLLEREQVRQRLLAAVLRLPEPFRAAVLLRYYEELSPAQIARRLGIPAATVRTRVARGLERLRAELDAEHGGERAAWALPLIAFPGAPTPVPVPLTELLLMKKTVAVGAVALLAAASFVLAWWVWFVPPTQPSLPAGHPAQSPSLARADAAVGTNQGSADPEVARRTAADGVIASSGATAEPGVDGELLVDVVWADGVPAVGVQVHVGARDGVRRPLAMATTDEQGQVRTRVAIGTVAVTADRQSEPVEGEVTAGALCRLQVKLEAGIDATGYVRDARGAAVAGASVWMTSYQAPWCAMAVVATSDGSGRFQVRAVGPQQSLGATAPGFAPSALVDLERVDRKQTPVNIELQLGDGGGSVTGRVTDADGKPVTGAIVAIGSSDRLVDMGVDGRMVENWAPRQVRSDGDGVYRSEGLLPGPQPVEVWAGASPFWHGTVTVVAGETTKLDIALAKGAVVHGVVTGEDGAPLAAAVVRAFPKPIDESFLMMGQYDYVSTFGYPSATADANGRYRLPGVAVGEVQLYAGPMRKQLRWGEVVPWAHATVTIAAGATVEWNPKVDNGPTIRGVVRYRDGAPMPDSFVNLVRPGEKDSNSVVTDKQGRFSFIKLQARGHDVSVQVWNPPQGAPPIEARDVWPDRGELELVAAYDAPKRLAKGSVKGRVVDSGGRCPNAAALRVVLVSNERSWNTDGRRDDGAFVFTDVEPGNKRILVMNGEEPILIGETFELQPAETKDLGVLTTMPGGKLRLVIEREAGTEAAAPTIHLRPDGSLLARKVEIGTANELVIDNLCLGEHTFSAWQEDLVFIGGTCHVDAASMATCTIRLQRAVPCELVVEYDAGQRLTKLEVLDQRGAVAWAVADVRMLERPVKLKPNLPLGSFTLRAHTAAGVAEAPFTLTSYEPGQPPVVVRAK